MRLSIIIPALNEEVHLPGLLKNIREQKFNSYEILVADAGSTDKTVRLAKTNNAKIVPGGLPPVGRNNGAHKAKGDFLLFLDADVTLPENFLKNAFNEIEEKFYDLATCELNPKSNLSIDKAIHTFFNIAMKMSSLTNPMAPGCCIFITRRLFNRIGGFQEDIKLAEDFNLVKRASNYRPLLVLESTHVDLSVRRLKKEGRMAYIKNSINLALYRTFIGEVRDDSFHYEFGNFKEKDDNRIARRLRKIDHFLIEFDLSYKRYKNHLDGKREAFKQNLQEQFAEISGEFKDLFRIASEDDSEENIEY